ncbi:unnamed protein product [Bursaphelenchus okinawaensis]|uniref:RING-type domain-containing protein n=1 Tax=Bursaphelenchus okinawaensis TaxID=465554 RepID=A0A811LJN1_9BILA|nr:unnamed protein product [Bursaphelenchus okinawaensis]CAG9124363.1 unnamed protein product [Bursaphelenchus okinawaensis]
MVHPDAGPSGGQDPGPSGRPVDAKYNSPDKCVICWSTLVSPYSTICAHTFCRSCIMKHLTHKPFCPVCETTLDVENKTHLIPNHKAAELIECQKKNQENQRALKRLANEMTEDLALDNMSDLLDTRSGIMAENTLIKREIVDAFKRQKRAIKMTEEQKKRVLLNEFFDQVIEERETQLNKIQDELVQLRADKARSNLNVDTGIGVVAQRVVPNPDLDTPRSSGDSPSTMRQMKKLKKRINQNLTSLEPCYFDIKSDVTRNYCPGRDYLDEFSNVLTGISQYAEIKRLATLNYNIETTSNLSIVSSIEFDKDGDYFVVAGVTKKIKLYDYNAVVNSKTGIHYPLQQLQCTSKISNVSWNPYIKNVLASSDYDGKVQLWDTTTCKNFQTFREHEKRCWTVQFNNVDPHIMASGSDDAKVKIWTMNQPHSVGTIDAKVNVCCVYFSPTNRNNFVFGSADHGVHLYDLRNTTRPVSVFRGHKKAVSYVKYCNDSEVVSASTDSTLRLWDAKSSRCKRTMRGHINERNFVGLATDGNHMVCGSENNQLYVYFKNVEQPILKYDFTSRQGDSEANQVSLVSPNETSTNDFVSAVCWRKNSNVVVAANSQGTTHILQLL